MTDAEKQFLENELALAPNKYSIDDLRQQFYRSTIAGTFYVKPAPSNGNEYVYKDGDWAIASSGGIGDAPNDGQEYVRKNLGWAVATGGGGGGSWGSITGTLSNQTDLQSALDAKLDSSTYTAADVKTKYESNADTNAFTDALLTKLNGIEAGAEVNPTNAETKTAYEANANTNAFTDAEQTKLTGTGTGANLVTVVAGTNVSVDNTDPQNPVISATAGGGIPDAPVDGNEYVRKDAAWVLNTDDYLGEAPNDGQEYVRKNQAWAVATGGGGGLPTATRTSLPRLSVTPQDIFTGALGTVFRIEQDTSSHFLKYRNDSASTKWVTFAPYNHGSQSSATHVQAFASTVHTIDGGINLSADHSDVWRVTVNDETTDTDFAIFEIVIADSPTAGHIAYYCWQVA